MHDELLCCIELAIYAVARVACQLHDTPRLGAALPLHSSLGRWGSNRKVMSREYSQAIQTLPLPEDTYHHGLLALCCPLLTQ
jgi:hypothetical protein